MDNVEFTVGGYYRDRNQGYSVIEKSAKATKIKFDDGTVKTLSPEQSKLKARIYRNIVSEERRNHLSTDPDYFKTLGFLSTNGRFEAELPFRSVQGFLRHYRQTSGEAVTTNHSSVIELGDVDKWGPELRIYFPISDFELDFGPNVQARSAQTPKNRRINNNAYWNRLIGLGFRLGNSHDVAAIRGTIPPAHHASFDSGTIL